MRTWAAAMVVAGKFAASAMRTSPPGVLTGCCASRRCTRRRGAGVTPVGASSASVFLERMDWKMNFSAVGGVRVSDLGRGGNEGEEGRGKGGGKKKKGKERKKGPGVRGGMRTGLGEVVDRLRAYPKVLAEDVAGRVRDPVGQVERLVLGRLAVVEDLAPASASAHGAWPMRRRRTRTSRNSQPPSRPWSEWGTPRGKNQRSPSATSSSK